MIARFPAGARRRTVILLLILALTATGCARIARSVLQPPSVALQEIRLVDMSVFTQSYQLVLMLDNPNPIALPIEEIEYVLEVAGIEFARGENEDGFVLPANEDVGVVLNIRTNLLDSANQLARLLSEPVDQVDYELRGTLRVDNPLLGEVPFRRGGKVPFLMPRE